MTARLAAIVLFFSLAASAQTKTTVALQLITEGMDAYATERNATNVHFLESDPLARPFVSHGTLLLAGYFATDAALKIGAEYWLSRHHQQKLARLVSWIGVADSTWGAETSFRGYHR